MDVCLQKFAAKKEKKVSFSEKIKKMNPFAKKELTKKEKILAGLQTGKDKAGKMLSDAGTAIKGQVLKDGKIRGRAKAAAGLLAAGGLAGAGYAATRDQ